MAARAEKNRVGQRRGEEGRAEERRGERRAEERRAEWRRGGERRPEEMRAEEKQKFAESFIFAENGNHSRGDLDRFLQRALRIAQQQHEYY